MPLRALKIVAAFLEAIMLSCSASEIGSAWMVVRIEVNRRKDARKQCMLNKVMVTECNSGDTGTWCR